MSTPPPLPAAVNPAPKPSQPIGCLPALVFLLTLACAAGVLVLKAGLLPKEPAGRVVVEINGSPSGPVMQAHAARIRSEAVLERAANSLDRTKLPAKERAALANSVEVEVNGPFLTVAVRSRDEDAGKWAGAVAAAYEDYLAEQVRNDRKREDQARQAYIKTYEADQEKARLEWMDMTKKLAGMAPGARDLAREAAAKELASIIGKERAAIVGQEAGIALYSEGKPEEAKAEEQKDLALRREALARYQKAYDDLQMQALHQASGRQEVDSAEEKFRRLSRELNALQEKELRARLEHSVVLVPLTVVEEAHVVKVPAQAMRQRLQLGLYTAVVALAAILLSVLTAKCCRRA